MDEATDAASLAGDAQSVVEDDDEEARPYVPEMSRDEIQRLDKERITKLRKLKMVLGFKRKAPATT